MRIFVFENGLDKAPTEYTQNLVYPYSAEYSHDTALGAATVNLRNTDRSETFSPGTVVMIGDGHWQDNNLDQWLIVDTNRTTNHASGKHSHTLYLCDITKQLEREIVGNKTFTKQLAGSGLDAFNLVECDSFLTDSSANFPTMNDYRLPYTLMPFTTNTITFKPYNYVFPSPQINKAVDEQTELSLSIFVNGKLNQKWTYIANNGRTSGTATYRDESGTTSTGSVSLEYWLLSIGDMEFATINANGVVEIVWGFYYPNYKNQRNITSYTFKDSKSSGIPTEITLKDACSILWKIARDGEKVEIRPVGSVANKAMAQEIVDVDISGKTLRESLDTIAGIGGCFCRYRLEYGQYKGGFDHVVLVYPISSRTVADLSQLGRPIVQNMADSIEGSCASMDSTVSNLVCESDSGTVAEPTSNAWKSLRSEEVRITEDSCRIEVSNKIYSVSKLEVLYGEKTADITKYLREQTAYEMLSSYAPAYPQSKAYAIKYKRGTSYIDGLSFEVEDAVSNVLKSPSIVNICNAEFGTSYSDLGLGSGMLNYTGLRFRVTYTPLISARVKQTKPDAADNATTNSIFYNQSDSFVDAKRYGRNIAGAAERGGQPGRTMIYKAPNGAKIPTPGTLHPANTDYTISKVTVERGKDSKTVQLDLAKHFNRLNPFIGIDSSPRLFEISEHEYINRDVMIEDYCIIGTPAPNGAHGMITAQGLNGFANAITMAAADGLYNPEIAVATGIASDERLNSCVLPIASFGIGRSLAFVFGYKDNYSAGDSASITSAAGVNYSLKEAVPYANVFGEFETADIKLYGRQGTAGIDPNRFPAYEDGDIDRGNVIFDSAQFEKGVQVYKDGRECIRYTYQIHFVTNAGWIISPGMAEDFRMITRRSSVLNEKVRLYRLSYELSRVDTAIDLSKATAESYTLTSGSVEYVPLAVDSDAGLVRTNPVAFDTYREYNKFKGDGKAWALAYEGGKLLFGSNEPITSNTQLPDIAFSFRHRIK